MKTGTLFFYCGKMGAGKSTKSKQTALQRSAVLLSEDEWLESLYPNKIASLADYLKYSNRLKPQIKNLAQSILVAGVDVVMDFPANTKFQRAWFASIYRSVSAPYCLTYIDVPDEVCIKHIEKRRLECPERAKTDTPEMFAQVTKFFEEPSDDEGFDIIHSIG
jgi:predicted kinase